MHSIEHDSHKRASAAIGLHAHKLWLYLRLEKMHPVLHLKNNAIMKKHLRFFFFGLLTVLLACQSSPSGRFSQEADSTTSPQASHSEAERPLQGIAYVNSDSLLLNYDFYKDAQKELDKKRKGFEADLNRRLSSLERDIASFRQNAPNMTLQQAQQTEQSLMQRQQSLAEYGQSLERQYADEEFKYSEKINKNLREFMERYAKENGYYLIIGYRPGATVWYGDERLDITQEVVKKLNEEYRTQQKSSEVKDNQNSSKK